MKINLEKGFSILKRIGEKPTRAQHALSVMHGKSWLRSLIWK